MNAYQRRSIRICSVGFAVAAVALIHLDSSEIHTLLYPSWYERLVASFITAPMAGLVGGLVGMIIGSGIAIWHWLRSREARDS
jgi:hypothetical protein